MPQEHTIMSKTIHDASMRILDNPRTMIYVANIGITVLIAIILAIGFGLI